MRYSKEQTEESRRRLVAHSARHLKKRGFAASGVDALASSAGVTSGSFYKHFAGKSNLFTAIIETELRRTVDLYERVGVGDLAAAEAALASYLSPQHVSHPETGCPLPALAADVARADDATRAAFDDGLRAIQARLVGVTGCTETALALVAQTVGAVMLARAALAPELRTELLAASHAVSCGLLRRTC